jgi:hypothetical protein
MRRADVVLVALRSWGGPDGTVCAPVAEIAALTDLSEAMVLKALSDLCADRRLVFSGRRDRRGTAIFHLSQGCEAEAAVAAVGGDVLKNGPHPTDSEQAGTPAAADAAPGAADSVTDKPCDPEPSDEEVAEMRRIGLEHAYAWLDRWVAEIGKPDLGAGPCGECGAEARVRWSFGLYVLCRDCRRRRARVAAKVASEAVGQSAVTGAADAQHAGDPVPPHRELVLVDPPDDDGPWQRPDF